MSTVYWVITGIITVLWLLTLYKCYDLCKSVIALDTSLEYYAKKVLGDNAINEVKRKYKVPIRFDSNGNEIPGRTIHKKKKVSNHGKRKV
jgi:hypothetical protein